MARTLNLHFIFILFIFKNSLDLFKLQGIAQESEPATEAGTKLAQIGKGGNQGHNCDHRSNRMVPGLLWHTIATGCPLHRACGKAIMEHLVNCAVTYST